jgi:pilus assembly protein CpaF
MSMPARPAIHITAHNLTLEQAVETIQNIFNKPNGTEAEIRLHDEIIKEAIAGDHLAREQLTAKIEQTLRDRKIGVSGIHTSLLAKKIFNKSYGMDDLQEIWDNPNVDEIKVNRFDNIWYIERGINKKANINLKSDDRVAEILGRLLMHSGKQFTKDSPKIRIMRKDMSRLTATRPPFSRYYNFALRKLTNFELTEENYLITGTISIPLLNFIKCLIRGRITTIFSGPTNSGKSTDLMFFLQYLPETCRIALLDKTGELFLQDRYPERDIVELQEVERVGLTLDDAFDTILSFTPNIVIVPEVRGEEGTNLLNACTRGHDGSLTTGHANSAEDFIENFPYMIMEDGKPRDPNLLRMMVARAFNIIIQKSWNPETGQRRIESITEIFVQNDQIIFVPLIEWDYSRNEWMLKNYPSQKIRDRLRFYNVPYHIIEEAGLGEWFQQSLA